MRKVFLASLLLLPGFAFAHHFMGGETPRTFMQGLLSGLGHPLIGVDHAAFIIGAGFALGSMRDGLWGLGALIAGTLLGAALHLSGIAVPASETLVAVSVMLVAAVVVLQRPVPLTELAIGLAAAGALHGYAYAESIFGAERAVLAAYLAGFTIIQACVAGAALLLHRKLRASALRPVLGAAIGAVGALFLVASF
ncbi:MAG TPA: HupE/UreJ family protein [Burkholderiales bacterium]